MKSLTILSFVYLFLSSLSCSTDDAEWESRSKLLKRPEKSYLVWSYHFPRQGDLSQYLDLKEEETVKSRFILKVPPFAGTSEQKPAFVDAESKEALELFEISFDSQTDAKKILKLLREKKDILFFEENFENISPSYTFAENSSFTASSKWWFEAIGCSKSISLHDELRVSGNTPVIAVLDSGIDTEHPYLQTYLWENQTPGSFGCPEDRFGCDTSEYKIHGPALPYKLKNPGESCSKLKTKESELSCNHATHLAGLIAGVAKEGLSAQKPPYSILNIKVVSEKDGAAKVMDSSVLRALDYIKRIKEEARAPIRIVNLSFGKPQRSTSLSFFIDYLTKTHPDLLLIAAAGNEQKQTPFYPAAEPSVLAVTALNSLQDKASYANYGSWVDLSAPGGDQAHLDNKIGILSSVPGGKFALSKGTSMAAPFVSAAAALIAAKHPDWTAKTIADFLKAQASSAIYEEGKNTAYQPIIFPENKKIPLLGSGLLNISSLFSSKEELQLNPSNSTINPTERIENSCGAVGFYKDSTPEPIGFLLYFFFIPLILAMIGYSIVTFQHLAKKLVFSK